MGEIPPNEVPASSARSSERPESRPEGYSARAAGEESTIYSEGHSLPSQRSTGTSSSPEQSADPIGGGGGEGFSFAPGSHVGPYRIEARIGTGGMGVVFQARDTRLNRDVALKIIHPATSNPQLQAAFLREARLASSLNHPGIVTIYDILFLGGLTCIVMEFVSGVPLHRLIPQGGLAIDRALEIGCAIGNAVAAAHAAGVVHRDLKPANVLVRSDDSIKILDFGLATMMATVSPDADTEALSIFHGSAVGTVGYMPPEQADGRQADTRADIFSFGVILYRMFTGVMPFSGASTVDVLRAIHKQDPPSMRSIRPEIPQPVEMTVRRALASNPADRFQTMGELLEQLGPGISRPSSASPQPTERSIVVLPFTNISPEPENEYLCDGLAEELMDGLTRFGGLRVVSRSSSFQFKGTNPDLREIGQRLGVRLVVNGSLRRSSANIRLTVQLTQTSDGYQVWSKRFDAKAQDLFALQDELTSAVLEELRPQLGARFSALHAIHDNPAPEAYDLYLRARYAFNRETPMGFQEARDLFRSAAAADPKFAPAWIGIAETHMRLEWYGVEPASEAAPAVKSALDAALRLRPDSATGLCNLAITQAGWDWDWAAAAETFQRALKAGPDLATVHFHYGLDFLTPHGRLREALEEMRLAGQLEPLSAIVNTAIGGCLYRMQRFAEAFKTLEAALETAPGFGHAHWSLGRVLIELGRWDEAIQHFDRAAEIMGHPPAALAESAYCQARMGRRDAAHAAIQELRRRSEDEPVSPLSEALVYAGLGEDDAAMERLEVAFQMRMRQSIWVNVDPRFTRLRNNPGFRDLIFRIGLPPLR